jgi:hypothetical protein
VTYTGDHAKFIGDKPFGTDLKYDDVLITLGLKHPPYARSK